MTSDDKLAQTPRVYSPGDCVIRVLGDIHLADGRRFKGVVVECPAGPPNISLSAVWEGTPVLLTVKP